MLYTQCPSDDFWRDEIRDERLRGSSRIGLRHRWNVYLQQSSELQESLARGWIGRIRRVKSSAPLRRTGERASQSRILFRLQLWRQAIDREVVRNDVVGKARAAANRPLSVSARIPGKTEPGREVVDVRFWRAEKQSQGWIIRNAVDGLQVFVSRNATVLITQSKVQGQPLRYFPIVLHKPIKGIVVVRHAA